jgi:cytosine permease
MAITFITAKVILGVAGILLSHATQTRDVVAILFQAAGWLGVTVIFLSTLKLNDVNLYSTSLHLVNAIQIFTGKELSRVKLTVAAGALGVLFSVMGILDHITQFLMLLGVVMAPVGGIVITDYFVLGGHRAALADIRDARGLQNAAPVWRSVAWIAWLLGAGAGYLSHRGVTTLTSFIASAIAYYLLNKTAGLFNSRGRSRPPRGD